MSNRRIIKQILREENSSWAKETRSFGGKDKGQQRYAETILKRRHKELVQFNRMRREEQPGYEGGYPNDYDEFILLLKNSFPSYDGFGHILQTTMKKDNPILMGMDILHMVRVVSEYILNYKSEDSNERVDVVPEEDLLDYIESQFFDCSDDFFKTIWDKVLVGRSNYWNEDIKDRMWEEIKDEVESKMEDDEGEEYSEFDGDINQEEDYFNSYWEYPLQSLGWDNMHLCEFYREYLDPEDFIEYFFDGGEKKDESTKDKPKNDKEWAKFPLLDRGNVYIIKRNAFFY